MMTNSSDEIFYERSMNRVLKVTLALAVSGSVAALAWRGWTWGAGFAIGATASWLNFRWVKQVADALAGVRVRRRLVAFAAFRYVILGAGAYVILMFSPISLYAALAGLFVSVAAVILEAVIELVYGRN